MAATGRPATAQGEPVKPYIVFIMDVSGSMLGSTGSGPPSCGGNDTRLDHAKCALTNIANTYGDAVIALGSFRQTRNPSDTNCADSCVTDSIDCSACDSNSANCQAWQRGADQFQVLVPLLEGSQNDVLSWVDLTCGTCTATASLNPELEAINNTYTPLAGTLRGAKRYLQGLSMPGDDPDVTGTPPYWSGPGDDPIRDDPLKDIFLTSGEQCRPYIVILLTDGAETCSPDPISEPASAAGELLITQVDAQDYRIETKPIGFGITAGDAAIEAIAHAGGAPDVGGQNEGFYATDEVGISTALAQIIQDALKSESCNDLDDDCDVAIDEDFPLKNSACDNGLVGICHSPGTYVCSIDGSGLECVLDNPGHPNPGDFTEVCNGLDDDCDNKVDEAPADCSGCLPFELCDGKDNDCDGRFDEGLVRTCGSNVGVCTVGTETCQEHVSEQPSGTWLPCTGDPPDPPERCNGLDDDCDGTVDGLQEPCSDLMGGNPNTGICRPGSRVCPTDGSGWSMCVGEVLPDATDPCDGLDNDCDTRFDEDFTPSDCSSNCGLGQTTCTNGVLGCDASTSPEDETCNAADDDCDGLVDEMIPDGGPCTDDGRCSPGTLVCDASTGGQFECRGGTLPGIEICDCEDNDCDGEIDEEDPNPLCAPGATCLGETACQCAFPCDTGEFPCPVGRVCVDDFCLPDLCYNVNCDPDQNGNQTECVDGNCVPTCDIVTCQGDLVCRGSDGACVPDNCISFPDKCGADQFCVGGTCMDDPCLDVDCPAAGEYCVGGNCVASCAGVECPDGQRCELGSCVTHPCGENCPQGEICDEDDGECKNDPCEFVICPTGLACDPSTGQCQDDPCLGVTCPAAGQLCVDGSCYNPDDLLPPEKDPPREYVAPGGGGACSTSAGGGPSWLLILGLALVAMRRRRIV